MSSDSRDPAPTATLSDLLFHVRDASAGRSDLLTANFGARRESWSSADFLRGVHSLAVALEDRGLRAGDRVVIYSENRPEWHLVDFACHLLGAPTVPIFADATPKQVAYILRNSGARRIFYSDEAKKHLLATVVPGLNQTPEHVAFDADAATHDGASLTRLMGTGAERLGDVPLERFRDRVDAADLAGIFYTSGTSGDPKGVMLSHGNLMSNVSSCREIFEIGSGDRAISAVPLAHIFQRTVDYLCFLCGVSIHYEPRTEHLADTYKRERPTFLVGTPELYRRHRDAILEGLRSLPEWKRRLFEGAMETRLSILAEDPDARRGSIKSFVALRRLGKARNAFGGRARFAISGGAPLATDVARFFEAIGIPLYQGYGLTETSPVLATNSPHHRRTGSVGKPISDVEMRIADDGEILVRGPGLMQGYWQSPEATVASVDESGWFRTGDLGWMDKSGYIFVTDRKQDLLTLADGRTLSPRPIENLLMGSGIEHAVIIGESRPFPVVLLTLHPEAPEGPDTWIEDRIRMANLQLPEELRIRKWQVLDRRLSVADGELTATMKPRRDQIRRRFAEQIAALYRDEPA